MNTTSLLELDARLSNRLRVAEKPGAVRNIAVFLAHSGDSWFWLAGLGCTSKPASSSNTVGQNRIGIGTA